MKSFKLTKEIKQRLARILSDLKYKDLIKNQKDEIFEYIKENYMSADKEKQETQNNLPVVDSQLEEIRNIFKKISPKI